MPNADLLKFIAEVNTGYLHSFGRKATDVFINLIGLRDGEKLLELGCGTGYTTVCVLSARNVFVSTTETKPEMLKTAERNVQSFGFGARSSFHLCQPGNPLPFADESFDKVYWEGVLAIQSTENFDFFINEAKRVLRPGGTITMNETIWMKGVKQETVTELNDYNEQYLGLRNSTQINWNVDDWVQHFKNAGLVILSNILIEEAISEHNGESLQSMGLSLQLKWRSMVSKLKKMFSPTFSARHKEINSLLDKYRNMPKVLEARFFVLKKM